MCHDMHETMVYNMSLHRYFFCWILGEIKMLFIICRHFTWSLFHKEVSSSKMRCFGSIMVEVIITFMFVIEIRVIKRINLSYRVIK